MDLISRQAAIDAINHICLVDTEYDCTLLDRVDVRYVLSKLPSAQPDVIRCKDCKHSAHWYGDKDRCYLWAEGGIDVFKDGFCNYAERRTDE